MMGKTGASQVEKALEVARTAYEGQFVKGGERPYFDHIQDVAAGFRDSTTKMIALLAEAPRTGKVSLDEIRREFGDAVAAGVDALNQRKDEPHFDYIQRLAENPQAQAVKKAIINAELRYVPARMKDNPEAQRVFNAMQKLARQQGKGSRR